MVYWIRCSLINWALLLSEQIEWGSVICCGDPFYDFWPLTLIQAVLQRHTLYSNAKCGVCPLLISLCHSWQWFLHKKRKKDLTLWFTLNRHQWFRSMWLFPCRFMASVLYGDSSLSRQLFLCTVVEYWLLLP